MEMNQFTYQGVDLRTANVFDLTSDAEYLKKFLSVELGVDDKDAYLELSTSESRVFDMFDYAETFQKTELINKLNELYKNELASFFNE